MADTAFQQTPENNAGVLNRAGTDAPAQSAASQTPAKPVKKKEPENEELTFNFRFFKNCSQSLKRFSIALFILNLFLIVTGAAVGVVYLAVILDFTILMMLAVPIVLTVAVLIVLARFLSALVYGFGEVVEKAERENEKAASEKATS